MYRWRVFHQKIDVFSKSRAEENTRKIPLLHESKQKGAVMKIGFKNKGITTITHFSSVVYLFRNRLTFYIDFT